VVASSARSRAENTLATLSPMLAAEIWYWWIGVVLTAVSVLAVLGLVAGYLKNVSSQRYPGKRHSESDL
jgi:hypothetical protein